MYLFVCMILFLRNGRLTVYLMSMTEPFGKERDAAIQKLARAARVEVMVRTAHTLYNLDK